MKTLSFAFLVSAGIFALAGCSEFTSGPSSTTTSSSSTLSTDSKGMTQESMTESAPAPEASSANATTDENPIPYPAIHSNGQGAGHAY
jgi:hypothetical protein